MAPVIAERRPSRVGGPVRAALDAFARGKLGPGTAPLGPALSWGDGIRRSPSGALRSETGAKTGARAPAGAVLPAKGEMLPAPEAPQEHVREHSGSRCSRVFCSCSRGREHSGSTCTRVFFRALTKREQARSTCSRVFFSSRNGSRREQPASWFSFRAPGFSFRASGRELLD
jgi:hypothetical protein